jgi:hypothetical protein
MFELMKKSSSLLGLGCPHEISTNCGQSGFVKTAKTNIFAFKIFGQILNKL